MRWEVTGERDLGFSRWHRETLPTSWAMLDIDVAGYCRDCHSFLYVAETALDTGQSHKDFAMTKVVAEALDVPGYVILYRNGESGVAEEFRVREISPVLRPEFRVVPQDVLIDLLHAERHLHKDFCDRGKVRFS